MPLLPQTCRKEPIACRGGYAPHPGRAGTFEASRIPETYWKPLRKLPGPDTRVRLATSPQRDLQAVLRSALHREGPRHKTPLIRNWLAKRPRFHLHFTPTSASWLNLVERWFGALTEKQIRRGAHRSTRELEAAIERFVEVSNEAPKPFVWTKTADQILDSTARFCVRTSNSGQ